MRVAFHEEALAEFREAALYYARRNPILANRFVEAVEDAIRRIIEAPTSWRMIDEDVRRCLTRVFPFGVLYTTEPDHVLIVAIMHCGREPGYWKARTGK